MPVVRLLVIAGWLGFSMLGGGCARPLPDVVWGESEGASEGSGVDSTGSDDTGVDDSGSDGGPVCGNGIVEAGEICDDAGESATCNDDRDLWG